MNKILVNFGSLLIYILPILLITGPFLPELAIILIIIFFFIVSDQYEKKYFLLNIYFKFFIFFWCVLIIISLVNQNFESFLKSIFYLRFGLFFVAIKMAGY